MISFQKIYCKSTLSEMSEITPDEQFTELNKIIIVLVFL